MGGYMNYRVKRILTVSSIALISIGFFGTIAGFTVAGFERKKIIKDPTTDTNLSISGDGKRLTSYYLDLGIWGTIDNTGYSFWALTYVYNGGSDPVTLKYTKGTLSGSNYEFRIDKAIYNRIKFFRTNSSNDSTLNSSTTYGHSYYTDTSPGTATDATGLLEFSSGNVTYQVTGWHGEYIDAVGFWR